MADKPQAQRTREERSMVVVEMARERRSDQLT
jgi:hypothetical protein